jgi:hypothetical protein
MWDSQIDRSDLVSRRCEWKGGALMRCIRLSLLLLCVLASLTTSVGAQQQGGAQEALSNGERASEIVEGIRFLRLLQKAKLGPEVLGQLLRVFEQAEQKRLQADAGAAAEMQKREPSLQKAQQALLDGKYVNAISPEEEAFAAAQLRLDGQRRDRLLHLAHAVRTILESSLSRTERAAALRAGLDLVRERRVVSVSRSYPSASKAALRELDRVRSSKNYAGRRLIFALSSAKIPNWWVAPGLYGPGRDAPNPAKLQPPDLSDPGIQAAIQPFLALADQVRDETPEAYQQRKVLLARQLVFARWDALVKSPVSDEEAMAALIEALVSRPPAIAISAIRSKLGRQPGK